MKKHCLVNVRTAEEQLWRMEFIQKWLAQHSIQVDIRSVCIEKNQVASELKKLMSDNQTTSIRTSHEVAEAAYHFVTYQKTAESMVHQQIEAILFSEGRWWPRCYGAPALIELIRNATKTLDNTARGLVVGDSPFVRVALFVLSQLGFTKLDLISSNEAVGTQIAANFKKHNFGLDLRLSHASDITLLSSEASILINTLREDQNPGLIEDLSYFNFLKAQGLVIDLYPSLIENRLIQEAKEVGLEIIAGQRLQARIDFLWLVDLYPSLKDSWGEYLQPWLDHCQILSEAATKATAIIKADKKSRRRS